MAPSPSLHVDVRTRGGQRGVFARVPFRAGQVVLPVVGEVQPGPTRYSLQTAAGAHLAPRPEDLAGPPSGGTAWRFLNHSCRPNARFDAQTRAVVAVKPVKEGDEVTLDYNATEWDLDAAFSCRCGADGCYGEVRGFRHLPADAQRELLPHAAPHIRRLAQAHLTG